MTYEDSGWHESAQEPDNVGERTLPELSLVTAAEHLAHDRLCVLFSGHADFLRVLCAPQVFRLNG